MNIADYRNNIRRDLFDIEPPPYVWKDESVDRAILKAINDLNRWVSDEKSYEITPTDSTFTETFDLTDYLAAWPDTVFLSRKALRFDSVTVAIGATTYEVDDDYIIDHLKGTISLLLSGDIPHTGTLTVTYKLSKKIFDLSSLIDLQRISKIDYPVNSSYQTYQEVTADLIGSLLYITTVNGGSQSDLNTGQRMVIYYYSRFTMPDDEDDGSIPNNYSEVICKGAVAFLLFAKAISITLGVETNLDDALEHLDGIDAILTALAGDINTDLAAAQAFSALADTHIATAITNLATALTYIDTEIVATDIVNVNAAIALAVAALTAAAAEVSGADTDTEGADTYTALANTALAAAITHQGVADTDIEAADSALSGATTYLGTGDGFIETVNSGRDPAGDYAKYAQGEIEIAKASVAEGEAILKEADISVAIGKTNVDIANAFIAQGLARLKSSETYLATAENYVRQAQLSQGNGALRQKNTELYIADAGGSIAAAKAKIDEAGIYLQSAQTRSQSVIAIVGSYISEAQEERGIAEQKNQLAIAIRQEASRCYDDFKAIISDLTQMRRNTGSVSRRQIA